MDGNNSFLQVYFSAVVCLPPSDPVEWQTTTRCSMLVKDNVSLARFR